MLEAIDKAIERSVAPDLLAHHGLELDEESIHIDERPFGIINDIVNKISELPGKYRNFESSSESLKKLSSSSRSGSGDESAERSNAISPTDERDGEEVSTDIFNSHIFLFISK